MLMKRGSALEMAQSEDGANMLDSEEKKRLRDNRANNPLMQTMGPKRTEGFFDED
jgi:hypothetical protein